MNDDDDKKTSVYYKYQGNLKMVKCFKSTLVILLKYSFAASVTDFIIMI